MVRLTADLVVRSPQCLNPLKERELILRGNKIPAIENLAVTMDGFDAIDLSDNEVRRLDNFPRMKRLSALFINNNHLVRIGSELGEALPNLQTLMLTGNKLQNLFDLEPLSKLTKLTMLSLLGNPVVRQPHYRLFVISTIPSLKILDFRKIKAKDRIEANKMFANKSKLAPADRQQATVSSRVTESTQKLSTEEQTIIKLAISKAKTNEDVDRLERMLLQGVTPEQLAALKASVFGKDAPAASAADVDMAVEEKTSAPTPAPAPAPVPAPAPAPAPAVEETPVASGTSLYKTINKVKYDRSALDLADHLSKDGAEIDADGAKRLWKEVQDGPGVTDIEAQTVKYILDHYKCSSGAKAYLEGELQGRNANGEASAPAPTPVAAPVQEPVAEDTAMEVEESAPAPAPDVEKTPFNWSKLKVVDLKKELTSRGLPKDGKKADLVARLTEHDPYNEKS